jgi:hypothetical protein
MPVKEIEKNPTHHNGTLTKKSSSVQQSGSKLAYIEGYVCL